MPTDDWERGYAAGWRAAQHDDVRDISRDMGSPKPKKKKRKASKYNKVYSKHYKKLKKKHPRSGLAALSKKAHRATKKELK